MGVSLKKIIVFRGVYWGPPTLRHFHMPWVPPVAQNDIGNMSIFRLLHYVIVAGRAGQFSIQSTLLSMHALKLRGLNPKL